MGWLTIVLDRVASEPPAVQERCRSGVVLGTLGYARAVPGRGFVGTRGMVFGGGVLILAVWLLALERVDHERDGALESVQRRHEALALAFEEYTIRGLYAADQLLQSMSREYLRDARRFDVTAQVRASAFDGRGSATAEIVAATSLEAQIPAASTSERGLLVGRATKEDASGRWRVPIARRIDAPGRPQQLAVLWVAPDYFTGFVEKSGLGANGVVAVIGLDGYVRARKTGSDTAHGMDENASALVLGLPTAPTGRIAGVPEGEPRLETYRKLADLPIVVTLGSSESGAMRSFGERQRNIYVAASALTLLLAMGALGLAVAIERELRQSEAALRRAQAIAGLGHVVCGPGGGFESGSQSLCALTGLAPAQLPASIREWLALVHPDDRERVRAVAIGAGREGARTEVEYRLLRSEGPIHVRQLIEPIEPGPGEPAGRWFCTMQDVTAHKLLEESVRSLNASLERRVAERTRELELANAELEAFTYSVSHDLRAPLRSIHGFSDVVIDDFGPELPEAAVNYLRRIQGRAHQMGNLIDDLLAFAHVGRQELRRRVLDTRTIFDSALAEAGAGYEGCFVLDARPLSASFGDFAMLKQVWVNLLSNALKYSSRATAPRVEVGCTVTRDGVTVYYIRDNGVGFDMAHADKLFGVFERLQEGADFPGTGVGLAIVRRIVERHGGRVWAESAPGEGATFYFTLNASGERNPSDGVLRLAGASDNNR